MKPRFFIYALFAVTLLACSDDDEKPVAFALDKSEIVVAADGANDALRVSAPSLWYASCDSAWVMVSPASGNGPQSCCVSVDSSLIGGVRKAELRFVSESGEMRTLSITQMGYGNIIQPDSSELHIQASQRDRDQRFFSLPVVANVAFDVSIEYADGDKAWLTPKASSMQQNQSARPRKTTLRFDWTTNNKPEERTATIVLTPTTGGAAGMTHLLEAEPVRVTVTQAAAQRIEDNRQGDSLAIVAIADGLSVYNMWDTSDNLAHWSGITLWEKNDKGLPCPEAIGRVRSAQFMMIDTNEGLPYELSYLKYAEHLSFYSNVNEFLKSIDMGTAVCGLKHLRKLEVFAYGITDLPEELAQLGPTLEELHIGGNNFDGIPAVLTPENFPHLRVLEMQACRRWTVSDLRNADSREFDGGIGLHFNTANNDALKRLLLWNNLQRLVLSYNYIEGQLPDFQVGVDGVEAWTQQDVDAWGGDTIQYLVGKPKILPNTTHLTLNLNYFTGNMPDWLLYHPHLLDWIPEQLIFNQMEYGINSEGQVVRFDNEPASFEYYYEAFPLYRSKYELKEEWTEE